MWTFFHGLLYPAGRIYWVQHSWLDYYSEPLNPFIYPWRGHRSLDLVLHHMAQFQSFLKVFTFTTCVWEELGSSRPTNS